MDLQNEYERTNQQEIESSEDQQLLDGKGIVHVKVANSTQNGRPSSQNDSPAKPRKRGGPRTPTGKERSKRNAVTHGIFADVVLFKDEETSLFRTLLQGFRDSFRPVGAIEETLVEKLATLEWRYRRMLGAETAEVQIERSYGSRAAEREIELRRQAAVADCCSATIRDGLIKSQENPSILNRCIHLLESLRVSVITQGFNPQKDREAIAVVYGKDGINDFRLIYDFCSDPSKEPEDSLFEEFALPLEKRPAKFLAYLQEQIDDLEETISDLDKRSAERKKLEGKAGGVPESGRLDRLLRYSASIDRAFDRTLNQLERMQRIRRGQPVAPTVNLHVS